MWQRETLLIHINYAVLFQNIYNLKQQQSPLGYWKGQVIFLKLLAGRNE